MAIVKVIKYKKGYKYQLIENFSILVDIRPAQWIITNYLALSPQGWLTIKGGYAWDGASGPAIDTKTFMRGSMVHDALYQIAREVDLNEFSLDKDKFREQADIELRRICQDDGMSKIRAGWVYFAVRTFAKRSSITNKDILIAP